jgi:hypothetical protein
MIPLDILVSSPSVRLPYKLESDDVAPFLFLSATTTVPNASFLFAILYAWAFLSAVCDKTIPLVSGFRSPSVRIALCTKALMWHLLSFFSQQPQYQMLWFFLLSCILGHCFQLCVVKQFLWYPGFVRPLLELPYVQKR